MVRNSAREAKSIRRNQDVYNLTELGYNLRIIFTKSLYSDGGFSNDLYDNIESILNDYIVKHNISPSCVKFEMLEISDNISEIINSAYIRTLYQHENEVAGILMDNNIHICIEDIPIMTNITKYGNTINVGL